MSVNIILELRQLTKNEEECSVLYDLSSTTQSHHAQREDTVGKSS